MSETTQLADFDPELAEELEVYDEMVEGEQCTGIVESVTADPATHQGRIKVDVTLPWNDTVQRTFKRPKDDPGGEFQQFVESIGYRLNSAKEIIGEEVPCEYRGSEWVLIIPESRQERIVGMVGDGWQGFQDILFGRSHATWVKALRLVSYGVAWLLLAPVFHFILWVCMIKKQEEKRYGNTDPAIWMGGMMNLSGVLIWVMMTSEIYFAVIA